MLPRGTIKQIVTYLQNQTIDANGLDSYILRFFGQPQRGWIDLGALRLRKGDLLYRLTHSKAALMEVTLIPGETLHFFFLHMAKKLELQATDISLACEALPHCIEGNFIPQTYKIPYGMDALGVLTYLLEYSKQAYSRFATEQNLIYGSKRWNQLLAKASIIQKEAADEAEMPLVSAVIDNRIKKGMPLQMDGSLNYGIHSHEKVTPKRIREDKSVFNTYKHRGIPPIPVGSVSFAALKAALFPADVPYLYFVRTKDGRHSFSQSYQEHKSNFSK